MTAKKTASTVTLWALRLLMAAVFLFTSFAKLSGNPMMVAEFARVGFGQWFRYFTATLELVGAIGVLIPGYSPFGAIVLLAVDVGAFVAQVSVLHMGWIHPIVFGLILGTIIYLQRSAFRGPVAVDKARRA